MKERIENRLVSYNDHIDTFTYSGPIGDQLVELGLAKFEELAVEFTTDQTGEVNVIDVVDLDTDQTMWDPKILDDQNWTNTDDDILECFISWYENNL
tara:strand:- start:13 stop:303 length:291 start_codon:yes stop_codon:yes gene_type:complete